MLNVVAVGRLAADPQVRQAGDTPVASFCLLVNKKIKDEDITSSIECSVWGRRGQVCMDFLKKGDQITVSGSATVRAYLRKNGEPGGSLDLNVADFSLPAKPKKEVLPF